jgi:hypothetical protein
VRRPRGCQVHALVLHGTGVEEVRPQGQLHVVRRRPRRKVAALCARRDQAQHDGAGDQQRKPAPKPRRHAPRGAAAAAAALLVLVGAGEQRAARGAAGREAAAAARDDGQHEAAAVRGRGGGALGLMAAARMDRRWEGLALSHAGGVDRRRAAAVAHGHVQVVERLVEMTRRSRGRAVCMLRRGRGIEASKAVWGIQGCGGPWAQLPLLCRGLRRPVQPAVS